MRKANLTRMILGFSLALVIVTSLAGCVVYDPYYPRYYSRGYYGYYYGYPYYGYDNHYRDRWD
ncbi:MAG TPA: hypothetical protein VL754_14125 [Verrucomicrobiae bacterium]|jgi:hypothetical protein|nr:hypothetical protein [Verrucomicrobiae bacterium]